MTDDRIAGTAKTLGGEGQEAFGKAMGDLDSQVKGKVKQVEGTAQDLYGQAKDTISDVTRTAREGVTEASDVVRELIESRPYTSAFAALCVGWFIGRMVRPR